MPTLALDPVPILETTDSGLLRFRDNVQLNWDKLNTIVNNLDSVNIKDGSIDTVDIDPNVWVENRYAAKYGASANPTAAAGWSRIGLDTVQWQDSSITDSTGSGDAYLCPIDGLYVCSARLETQANNNPQRFLVAMFKNNTEDEDAIFGNGLTVRGAIAGDYYNLEVNGNMRCIAGDKISIHLYNNGANSVQVNSNVYRICHLTVYRSGPYPT